MCYFICQPTNQPNYRSTMPLITVHSTCGIWCEAGCSTAGWTYVPTTLGWPEVNSHAIELAPDRGAEKRSARRMQYHQFVIHLRSLESTIYRHHRYCSYKSPQQRYLCKYHTLSGFLWALANVKASEIVVRYLGHIASDSVMNRKTELFSKKSNDVLSVINTEEEYLTEELEVK